MANKTVYQDFDTDALDYFGLGTDPIHGVLSNNSIQDVLVTQDVTTFNNINEILAKPTIQGNQLSNYKKAFILPNCNVSADRMKAALKEHQITVTNDYEKADVIVGHLAIDGGTLENGMNIPSSIMKCKLWNYELAEGLYSAPAPSGILTLIQNSNRHVILTRKILDTISYSNFELGENLYDVWMLTGLAINLAWKIQIDNLAVVDVETVLHSSANKVILDEELLGDLRTQHSSYNTDDKEILGKIVPTIDYTQNYHLLWQFSQDCYNIASRYNRDKDMQYWIGESRFEQFTHMGAEEMILWLEENDLLNTKSFKYLEPIVRSEIRIHNRDLYTFKVSVKKEYKKYLKNV
jgi:hypothetical protein